MSTFTERARTALSSLPSQINQNPQAYAGLLASARFIEQTPVPPNQFPDSQEVAVLWPWCCCGLVTIGALYTLVNVVAGARRRTQFEAVQPELVEPRDK